MLVVEASPVGHVLLSTSPGFARITIHVTDLHAK